MHSSTAHTALATTKACATAASAIEGLLRGKNARAAFQTRTALGFCHKDEQVHDPMLNGLKAGDRSTESDRSLVLSTSRSRAPDTAPIASALIRSCPAARIVSGRACDPICVFDAAEISTRQRTRVESRVKGRVSSNRGGDTEPVGADATSATRMPALSASTTRTNRSASENPRTVDIPSSVTASHRSRISAGAAASAAAASTAPNHPELWPRTTEFLRDYATFDRTPSGARKLLVDEQTDPVQSGQGASIKNWPTLVR